MFEIAVEISQIETWGNTFDRWSQIMVYAGDVILQEEDYWMVKSICITG
jgi:hypothetical protein